MIVSPGNIVVAINVMRSWETDDRKGRGGAYINAGDSATVVQAWIVGNQQRIRVMVNDGIMLFSCPIHAVGKNWKIIV